MKRYPLAPLENEVLVQSNGIVQWLKLALASNPKPTKSVDNLVTVP